MFKNGKLDRLDGGSLWIEFGTGEAMEVKKRTAGHVYALANREERTQRVATGRSDGGIVTMLGLQPQVVTPPPYTGRGRGRRWFPPGPGVG